MNDLQQCEMLEFETKKYQSKKQCFQMQILIVFVDTLD